MFALANMEKMLRGLSPSIVVVLSLSDTGLNIGLGSLLILSSFSVALVSAHLSILPPVQDLGEDDH